MSDIFVFGSNLAGRHGKGAALHARRHYGAIYGQGEGFQGRSYAIPTKNFYLQTLPIQIISFYVDRFILFATRYTEMEFLVTAIGTGLAGYSVEEIAPLFDNSPPNCIFYEDWHANCKR